MRGSNVITLSSSRTCVFGIAFILLLCPFVISYATGLWVSSDELCHTERDVFIIGLAVTLIYILMILLVVFRYNIQLEMWRNKVTHDKDMAELNVRMDPSASN